MQEKIPSRKSWLSRAITLGVAASLALSGYTLFLVLSLKPGEKVSTPIGVIEKPEKRFKTAFYDNDGNLIISYSDDSQLNVGKFDNSQNSQTPTPAPTMSSFTPLVEQAVAEVCANDKCKADAPSLPTVVTAVMTICNQEPARCKGDKGNDGVDGKSVTDEQLATQIAAGFVSYCSTRNNCVGETGATGATGANGRTPVLSCVIRWDVDNNTITRYWFAQKYEGEPDSAYVNKYRLQSEQAAASTGTTCVDLRSTT